jgi:hypothetical protein
MQSYSRQEVVLFQIEWKELYNFRILDNQNAKKYACREITAGIDQSKF